MTSPSDMSGSTQTGFFGLDSPVRTFVPNLFTVASGSGDYAAETASFATIQYPTRPIAPNSSSGFQPTTLAILNNTNKVVNFSASVTVDTTQIFPVGAAPTDELRIRPLPVSPDPSLNVLGWSVWNQLLQRPEFLDVRIRLDDGSFITVPGVNERLIARIGYDGVIRLLIENQGVAPHTIRPVVVSDISGYFPSEGTVAMVFTVTGTYFTS